MARLPLIFEAVGYALIIGAAFLWHPLAGAATLGLCALWEGREAQR